MNRNMLLYDINQLLFFGVMGVSFLACAAYLVFFISQKNHIRVWARSILTVSWLLQTAYIAARYLAIGNTPITTYHETVFFFAWATTSAYLSFRWRYTVRNFGTFVSLLIFGLLLVSSFTSREVIPLEPALQSWWLPVHAGISLIAYGFLALAFCGAIMYLLQERELKSRRLGYFFPGCPRSTPSISSTHIVWRWVSPFCVWAWSPACSGPSRPGELTGAGIPKRSAHLSSG